MDMLPGNEITDAALTDWRKLAQGLHARYRVGSFGEAARFVTDDAIYRDDDGTEHVVEWPTQQDVDLARRITDVAAGLGLEADPAAVAEVELGLEVAESAQVAAVWAALLTGDAASQGRGTPGDEVRDGSQRVPNLWFDDPRPASADGGQRWHVEVYVPAEARDERIAAAVAAGATVVDDSEAPGLTVVADQEGNRGVIWVA